MAGYLSGTEQLSGARLVDSFVQLRSGGQPVGAATNVEVIDPDGKRPLSLAEARNVQSFRLERAGFYQVRFGNGRDAVIGVNPDRRESDLQSLSSDVQHLWSGSSSGGESGSQKTNGTTVQVAYRPVSLWWYVMFLAFLVLLAETAFASQYLGTPREEI
jgi:hypothetical protein